MKWEKFILIFFCVIRSKTSQIIFSEWKNSMLLNDVVRSIDLFFIPLICSFFLEASRPGLVTRGKLLLALGVQAVFAVIFAFYPDEIIVILRFIGTGTLVLYLSRISGTCPYDSCT